MTLCPANDLIFSWLCRSCERCLRGATRLQFYFPIHIGNIFIIEHGTSGGAQLHDDKIMDNGAAVCGIESNFLPGRDRVLARLELKVGQRNIDGRGWSARPARNERQAKKHSRNDEISFHSSLLKYVLACLL